MSISQPAVAAAIDVLVSVGGRISFSSKIIVDDTAQSLFCDLVQDALLECVQATLSPDPNADEEEDPFKVEALRLRHCITSVKCRGVETTEFISFLRNGNANLKLLNSKTTPFVRDGLVIYVSPKPPTASQPSKPKVNAFSIMLGTGEPSIVRFLDPPPTESSPQLHTQIKTRLSFHLKETISLGHYNLDQKECLEKAMQ